MKRTKRMLGIFLVMSLLMITGHTFVEGTVVGKQITTIIGIPNEAMAATIYYVEKVINLDNALTVINEHYSNNEIIDYTRELKDGVIAHYQTLYNLMDDPEGKRGYFYTCHDKDGGYFYCSGK